MTNFHHMELGVMATLELSDLRCKHGPNFRYFDEKTGCFSASFEATSPSLSRMCSYTLPQKSSSLQSFLTPLPNTGGSLRPNDVIANASRCPQHICPEVYSMITSVGTSPKLFP
jgi:hypothetical protein